jgi:hypothetical protein
MPGCSLLGTAVLLPAAEEASQLGYLVMGEAVRKPRLPYEVLHNPSSISSAQQKIA